MPESATPRILSRPPISEALIDVRVESDEGVTIPNLRVEPAALPGGFAKRKEMKLLQSRFELSMEAEATSQAMDSLVEGYIYQSQDDLEIGQFRRNGFTYNRLAPYQGWDAMQDHGLDLWRYYHEHAGSIRATRIALRYINRIELNREKDLGLWLTAPPQVPKDAPGALSGLLSRVQTHDQDEGWGSSVVTTLEGTPGSEIATILLDIDVYKTTTGQGEIEEISNILKKLRVLKNALFFGSITQRTADIYS